MSDIWLSGNLDKSSSLESIVSLDSPFADRRIPRMIRLSTADRITGRWNLAAIIAPSLILAEAANPWWYSSKRTSKLAGSSGFLALARLSATNAHHSAIERSSIRSTGGVDSIFGMISFNFSSTLLFPSHSIRASVNIGRTANGSRFSSYFNSKNFWRSSLVSTFRTLSLYLLWALPSSESAQRTLLMNVR